MYGDGPHHPNRPRPDGRQQTAATAAAPHRNHALLTLFGGPSPLIASYFVGKGIVRGPMYWVVFVSCVAMVGQYFARKEALRISDALSSDGMVGAGGALPSEAAQDFVAANPTAAALGASTLSAE